MSSDRKRSGAEPPSGAPHRRGWRAVAVDVVVAGAALGFELGPVISGAPPWGRTGFGALAAVRLAGFTLPLLLRRRYPLAVLAVMSASFVGSELIGPPIAIAFYSIGAWSDRPLASRVTAVAGALVVTAALVAERGVSPVESLVPLAIFGGAWYLGSLARIRVHYTGMLEERARGLEAEREQDRRRAAAAERTRIARELHDIVAHRVSMMTVQAGAAGVVVDRDPDAARRAMAAVENAGRSTLDELRRLLGVLRADEDDSPVGPAPGLDRLSRLTQEMIAAGLDVRLTSTPGCDDLPEALAVSAYRIVQEALTNALKHGGPGTRADVNVRCDAGTLTIDVTDDGAERPSDPLPGGHGLIGMRERAAAFGGTLDAGPRPGGGYTVSARLPLEAQA